MRHVTYLWHLNNDPKVEATLWYGDLSRDEALANLRTFTEEVMPAVREQADR